jgi:hypothetical protein
MSSLELVQQKYGQTFPVGTCADCLHKALQDNAKGDFCDKEVEKVVYKYRATERKKWLRKAMNPR